MDWLLFLLFASAALIEGQADAKLLFVHSLFRHGDRTPMAIYPTDPNTADNWPEGFGQLTALGKKQQFVIGKYLRSMYSNFITSDPREVIVNSTEYERCLNSALSRMASLYAPNKKTKCIQALEWQPIPVYYLKAEDDMVLGQGSYCPRAFAEKDRITDTQKFQDLFAEYQDMITDVISLSGFTDWDSLVVLHDTLTIEKRMGLKIPEWADRYYDQLGRFADLYVYAVYNSEQMHRLRTGPLLLDIVTNMKNKIDGKLPHQRVQIYSAHDANIIVLLQALNLYKGRPPYCATVLFELHELSGGQYAVRLLYLNSTRPEVEKSHRPTVLTLGNCSEYCPLQDFVDHIRHLLPSDWVEECKWDGWHDDLPVLTD